MLALNNAIYEHFIATGDKRHEYTEEPLSRF